MITYHNPTNKTNKIREVFFWYLEHLQKCIGQFSLIRYITNKFLNREVINRDWNFFSFSLRIQWRENNLQNYRITIVLINIYFLLFNIIDKYESIIECPILHDSRLSITTEVQLMILEYNSHFYTVVTHFFWKIKKDSEEFMVVVEASWYRKWYRSSQNLSILSFETGDQLVVRGRLYPLEHCKQK